jgi:hypothetical protein
MYKYLMYYTIILPLFLQYLMGTEDVFIIINIIFGTKVLYKS